jgi:hypothetical protein
MAEITTTGAERARAPSATSKLTQAWPHGPCANHYTDFYKHMQQGRGLRAASELEARYEEAKRSTQKSSQHRYAN